MATGLFFGTFNPVHRGHEAMASSFLSSESIEELWVILTPTPPHKKNLSIAPFRHRWNMLQLAMSGRPRVQLSDFELQISSPHYTFKTISLLTERYREHDFALCIGSDTLQTLTTWYEYSQLSDYVALLVAARPGVPTDVPQELSGFTVRYCDHEMVDVSSTEIRQELASGYIPGSDKIHPDVARYIRDNKLYGYE